MTTREAPTRLRDRIAPRRVLAWTLAATVLGAVTTLNRPPGAGGLVAALAVAGIGAATLAQYVPTVGTRIDLGCTPCAVASGFSVPVAIALLSTSSGLAVLIATAGLVQRLRQPATCPT